jgi:glycosyltransferase involved in cell wall biosynthesis
MNRFFLLLSLALVALAITASASASSCKSDERLVHEISRPGPYGSEHQLNRALAITRLVATIHERLESAGVCYFAMGRTLEGVWRHAASMPHHAHSVDLAIESANFDTARQILLAGLESSSNYLVQGNHDDVDHIKVSIVIDGEVSASVNLFVFSRSEDGQRLVHPWLYYQPAIATVFPTKLASFHEGVIRVPADAKQFLVGQYGSELDVPNKKAFSWTHMYYVTPHDGMATEYPLVSVIIPTYERPQFLGKAIELIQRQDYPNLEIVVVDDGRVSQANNPDLAGALSASNVRYIHLAERLSIGAKRNIAVENCRGEIVVHWDDDDYFREHRISAQVAPIIRGEVDMTVLEHHYYYILPTQSFYIVKRASSWGPHFGTFVFRKSLFDSGIRYPDNSMAEDYAFAEFALNKGATVYVMNNEDGKHVYVRHHNTWEFDFADYDVQVTKVDRPAFVSDSDWEHLANLQSEPVSIKPPNHYSSELIQWNRPELMPVGSGVSYGAPYYYPRYAHYPRYAEPDYSVWARIGIGVGVAGSVGLVVVGGLTTYFVLQHRKKHVGYAPINNDDYA